MTNATVRGETIHSKQNTHRLSMQSRARYLIVDGHSVIFAWPELRKLHARRSSLAREALIKQLRDYQDWTGVRVVVVFDGSRNRARVRRGINFTRGAARSAFQRTANLTIKLIHLNCCHVERSETPL